VASPALMGSDRSRTPRPDDATLERRCHEYTTTRDPDLRRWIVEQHDWLVRCCARQMMRRGESLDDLVQVGTIGLLHAVDRFDSRFGVRFRTFASATIMGELRRHYRKAWRVSVSRSLQERHLAVCRASEVLTTQLQSTPTTTDIATYLALDVAQVAEAIAVGSAFSAVSLDVSSNDGGTSRGAPAIVAVDDAMRRVEVRDGVRTLLERLGERERLIVYLSFYCEKSQAEIAAEVGLSQVHVSRLLRRALDTLRLAA
jgi:RNA polymerase sigma-B factor